MATSLWIRNGSILSVEKREFVPSDIWIDGGVIKRIGGWSGPSNVPVLQADELWITPGLFDSHTHLLDGISVWGVAAERIGWRTGVTTLLDAGSAGSTTWPGFRRYFVVPAETRILSLLNISTIGMLTGAFSGVNAGELLSARYLDVGHAADCIETNRDCIVGVKVRLSAGLADSPELERLAFCRALELAERVRLPLMVHHSRSSISTEEIVSRMRPGDIMTHAYHGIESGIVDAGFRILPEVQRARERGVLFDVGHGAGGFSWRVARAACCGEGFWPDLVSTDLHRYCLEGPVYDMATTISKFIHLGMRPADAFLAASWNPWHAFRPGREGPGALREGQPAELALWARRREPVSLFDGQGTAETAPYRITLAGIYYKGACHGLHERT